MRFAPKPSSTWRQSEPTNTSARCWTFPCWPHTTTALGRCKDEERTVVPSWVIITGYAAELKTQTTLHQLVTGITERGSKRATELLYSRLQKPPQYTTPPESADMDVTNWKTEMYDRSESRLKPQLPGAQMCRVVCSVAPGWKWGTTEN